MTTITLTLPEQTMEQAQQAATALKRPVEEVLSDILAAVLPTVHDAPAEMQAELMRMTWLDSQELWRIAREQMPAEAQEQLRQLTHVQEQRSLTSKEQGQLRMASIRKPVKRCRCFIPAHINGMIIFAGVQVGCTLVV